MVLRKIKFNVKSFVEEIYYAYKSGDEEEFQELQSKFEKFYFKASDEIRGGVIAYLRKNSLTCEVPYLEGLLNKS